MPYSDSFLIVGQRVRLVRRGSPFHGVLGTVVEVNTTRPRYTGRYRISLNNGTVWWYDRGDLETLPEVILSKEQVIGAPIPNTADWQVRMRDSHEALRKKLAEAEAKLALSVDRETVLHQESLNLHGPPPERTEADARRVVDGMLDELFDHTGFGSWWGSIEEEIQAEIIDALRARTATVLHAAQPEEETPPAGPPRPKI